MLLYNLLIYQHKVFLHYPQSSLSPSIRPRPCLQKKMGLTWEASPTACEHYWFTNIELQHICEVTGVSEEMPLMTSIGVIRTMVIFASKSEQR